MLGPRLGAIALLLALVLAGCGSSSRRHVDAFPSPGARVASPKTTISFRGAPADALGTVVAVGSSSGRHAGRILGHSDGHGASFVPSAPFTPGEHVTVHLGAAVNGTRDGRLRFAVAGSAHPVYAKLPGVDRHRRPGTVEHFFSRPDLAPTRVAVDVDRSASGGDILVAPKRGASQAGPMILDRHGRLLWFHPLGEPLQAYDFKAQRWHGRPVVTWFQGTIEGIHGVGVNVIADSGYRPIATVRAGNGYDADLHEFTLEPGGMALVLSYNAVPWHGRLVEEGIVQEIDVATGAVLFEWHSLDHVPTGDSYFLKPKRANEPFDYFHVNSAQLLVGGDLIVSARHTHAIYRIDGHTGAVRWRLGGRHSDFRGPPATRFAWQHDARLAPDGTLTLFDNHDVMTGPGHQSRGLVLRVDEKRRRVALVRAVRHPRHLLSATQGNVETLPAGHLFVGWGGDNVRFSEFDERGRLVFDGRFLAPFDESYRAYRQAWTGRPGGRPAIALRHGRAYFSWNGATEVRRWRLLIGATRAALHPAQTVARRGFETSAPMRGRFAAAEALDAGGKVLGRSAVVSAP